VLSLSLLSGDCVTDKLDWTFRLYDIKRDGVISREELVDIITSIYDLLGDSAEPQVASDTVQQHTDAVFQVQLNLSHNDSTCDSVKRDDIALTSVHQSPLSRAGMHCRRQCSSLSSSIRIGSRIAGVNSSYSDAITDAEYIATALYRISNTNGYLYFRGLLEGSR